MNRYDRIKRKKELQEFRNTHFIKTIDVTGQEVYVYTNTRWGFKEYKGILRGTHGYDRLIIDILPDEDGYYRKWFATTTEEGKVKGSTIWFFEENREEATKAFNEHALRMADGYIDKSKASCSRVTKHKDEEEEKP